MADIDDFDIDRSIEQGWADFQTRLSEIISVIDESGDLTISSGSPSDDPAPFVRFSCPERDLVRCEAASNAALGEDYQLTAGQLTAIAELGWQPPQTAGDRPTGNFWVERPQEESDQLSELAVGVLRDIYGVQHPVFLAPDQLAEVLQPAPTPIEPPAAPGAEVGYGTVPRDRDDLDDLIDAELTSMYGHPPIRDSEGDVAIRVGSTMLFLRTSPDRQEVVIFSAVVHDVSGRSRAAEVLNDLNVEARWVKFQLIRDRVFVSYSVLARPFVAAHLHQAVRIVSDVADGIDDELAAKLNGRTTFSDRDESH